MYKRQKEVSKSFQLLKAINQEDLPGYIKHYVPEDENILVAYKTNRDHGVFTDKKVVLFDHAEIGIRSKQIYTIPYKSISILDLVFNEDSAEINVSVNSALPIKLQFVKMNPEDKVRLRLLYTCMNRIISDQEPLKEDVKRLQNNEVSLKK